MYKILVTGSIHEIGLEMLRKEKDIEIIEDLLSVNVEQTSINGGVPYVTSGILANNHCIIVGSMTSGSEIMNLNRAFLN